MYLYNINLNPSSMSKSRPKFARTITIATCRKLSVHFEVVYVNHLDPFHVYLDPFHVYKFIGVLIG